MEGLIVILIVVGLLVGFDLLALGFGVDSRELMGDDHARPIQVVPWW